MKNAPSSGAFCNLILAAPHTTPVLLCGSHARARGAVALGSSGDLICHLHFLIQQVWQPHMQVHLEEGVPQDLPFFPVSFLFKPSSNAPGLTRNSTALYAENRALSVCVVVQLCWMSRSHPWVLSQFHLPTGKNWLDCTLPTQEEASRSM